MKKALHQVPLPISAVMLSLATLGNAYKNVPALRMGLGIVAGILWCVLLLRILLASESFKKQMQNPVIASVFVTYWMGTMVLATYIKPVWPFAAAVLWGMGLLMHMLTAGYVLVHFIGKNRQVLPSHYVTFVGIVTASVTAPAFGWNGFGFWIWVAGFGCFLLLTPFVFYTLFWKKERIGMAAQPTKVIVAAPLSLCLTGYIATAVDLNIQFSVVLCIGALLLTGVGIVFMLQSWKKEWNPAYGAYTFPMVIAGVALKSMGTVVQGNALGGIVRGLGALQLSLAAVVVGYVLVSWFLHVWKERYLEKLQQAES